MGSLMKDADGNTITLVHVLHANKIDQHDLLPEKKKQIKISPIDTVHTQSLGDYDKDKVPIGWVVSVDVPVLPTVLAVVRFGTP